MARACVCNIGFIALLALSPMAQAFRNCDAMTYSDAYRGSSRYLVAELAFDDKSGAATGTATHFNFSNDDTAGVVECHVTYSIDGIYDAGSALFLLDGNRTNQSRDCDHIFVETRYPAHKSYTLHADFSENGAVEVYRGDSGEFIGRGSWNQGVFSYKTDEVCELF